MNGRTPEAQKHALFYKKIQAFGEDEIGGIAFTRQDGTVEVVKAQEQIIGAVPDAVFAQPTKSVSLQDPSVERIIGYPKDAGPKVKKILREVGLVEQGKLVVPARELPGLPKT